MDRLKKGFLSFVILALSLAFFTGIGLGEANRTYSKLKLEGVYALGETIKSVVDSFLGAGVPLSQFVGFDNVAAMVLEVDPSIFSMQIANNHGEIIFSDGAEASFQPFTPSKKIDSQQRYRIEENERFYRISIPLENKFEKSGELQLNVLKKQIHEKLLHSFRGVFAMIAAAVVLFLLLITYIDAKRLKRQKFWFSSAYASAVLLVAVFMLVTLIQIYFDGIQAKTGNLANSLAYKLSSIQKLDLDIDSFKGIDKLFQRYQDLNPEIHDVVLESGSDVLVRTQAAETGNTGSFIRHAKHFQDHTIRVRVDKGIVYANLWRSFKSFLILFVAALFMAALFLNLLFAVQRSRSRQRDLGEDKEKGRLLEFIKPLFFLGVFAEALYASFLPQYFEQIATQYALGPNGASFLFTAFFVAYALILLPAANYCQKHGEKALIIWSVIVFGLSSIAMAACSNYLLVAVLRLLAGLCQGALFIAVQSYLLRAGPEHRRTQSMAILIIQYNGGRIAGTAIGALAVSYFDASGVFLAGGVLSVLLCFYALKFVPRLEGVGPVLSQAEPEAAPGGSFFGKLKQALKDPEHVKTTFLIGINAKLVMIGVVGFALPLIMERNAFSKEDIGLVLMLYSAGVLISSVYSSKFVDRTGNSKKILFRGNQGSGFGLICIGIIGLPFIPALSANLLVIAGTFILGLSHGFIAAPIMTHIAETLTSRRIGRGPSVSIFRVFERAGNILGPLLVGQLLVMSHYSSLVISAVGGFILICGLLFILRSFRAKALLVLLALCFLFGRPGDGVCTSSEEWFRFTENRPNDWRVVEAARQEKRFKLVPKPETGALLEKTILVLIPKKSSAYVTSLETVLRFFSEKKLYPRFEVANYDRDAEQGRNILQTAVEQEVDLIFAMGSLSADFVFNHFQGQDIPVVTICAKDPVMMQYISDYEKVSGSNFAYTSLNIPVKVQMIFLQELIPDLRNIGILYARNNASAVLTQADPLREYAENMGINVLNVAVDDQDKARQELKPKVRAAVQRMKANDPGLQRSVFYVTGSTCVFSNFDVINANADQVPVIGVSPSMVKGGDRPGAMLAVGVGFENNAQLAAIYAEKILKGEKKPGELPVGVISPPDIAINFKLVREIDMKIPYSFFELANFIFNYQGEQVKRKGMIIYEQ